MSEGNDFNHDVQHETEDELLRENREDRFLGLLVIASTCAAITTLLLMAVWLSRLFR